MKILIRATNWVGDAIMALPALRAVRAAATLWASGNSTESSAEVSQ